MRLSEFDRQVLDRLQLGLSVTERPFLVIADELNVSEDRVLASAGDMKDAGLIRRIGPTINYRILGFNSTLIAASVTEERLKKVTDAIKIINGVSHCYLRNNPMNLWFTMMFRSCENIEEKLSVLSKELGTPLYNLPAETFFKLNVFFGKQGGQKPKKRPGKGNYSVVKLSKQAKSMICGLQKGLEIVSRPYMKACSSGEELNILGELMELGVVKKINASVNQYKLGFTSNVMFCAKIDDSAIAEAGNWLSQSRMVSHCYSRKTCEAWNLNFFAMVHAENDGAIKDLLQNFVEKYKICEYSMLPTVTELKKQPVSLEAYEIL